MTAPGAGAGEIAVIGLARSGRAAAELLAARGARVYASDLAETPELAATADALTAHGVSIDLGRHDLERLRRASRVVVSPGIPPDALPLAAARGAGVPVLSEIAVALEQIPDASVIAITGTNGKSTTTALIAHLLHSLGRAAVATGNIGKPLSEVVMSERRPQWIALEISSFQLHDTPAFSPRVGVLTNLAPDHLDRYASVAEYYADKRRLFESADERSRWVTNADDSDSRALVANIPGDHFRFSTLGDAEASYDRAGGSLRLFGEHVCRRAELPLFGDHNVANALAGALAVAVADEAHRGPDARAHLAQGLRTFGGLPHRLELVAEEDGVQWINDSKATNVASARVAVEAMTRPTVLLLGGRHKGQSYAPLAEPVRRRVRALIAYGEAADIIAGELGGAGPPVQKLGRDFAEVVRKARSVARSGDTVLLAPACSSFDMFRDYEERGEAFRALVQNQ